MIERKIYSQWAFRDAEREKAKMNHSIYKEELEPKSKAFWGTKEPTKEELEEFTCYKCVGTGYGHKKYKILSNPHDFSVLQLALICDSGNLCFGYRKEGDLIVIHTD